MSLITKAVMRDIRCVPLALNLDRATTNRLYKPVKGQTLEKTSLRERRRKAFRFTRKEISKHHPTATKLAKKTLKKARNSPTSRTSSHESLFATFSLFQRRETN